MSSSLRIAVALVLSLVLCTAATAADTVSAKVIAVKKYEQGRVVHWEKYVPIYDGYPVYDIALQTGGKTYVVRYESMTGYYPNTWNAGNTIQVKQERGRFLLLRGEEQVPANIVSDHDCIVNPTRNQSLPQLPCPE
jgi:hypothetical protein